MSYKDQYSTLDNQSNFHNALLDIFRSSSYFMNMRCFQEVPVKDLVPGYPDASHRYDWYIKELNCVIELHGEQHYSMSNRGNVGYNEAVALFKGIQERDFAKKYAAIEAGIIYVEIPYKDKKKLSEDYLKSVIFNSYIQDT